MPGRTLRQDDESGCGYFAAAAAKQVFESSPPLLEYVLKGEDVFRVVHATKRDILRMLRTQVHESGFVKGQLLSQKAPNDNDKTSASDKPGTGLSDSEDSFEDYEQHEVKKGPKKEVKKQRKRKPVKVTKPRKRTKIVAEEEEGGDDEEDGDDEEGGGTQVVPPDTVQGDE